MPARTRIPVERACQASAVKLAGSQINKLETNVSQPTLATALAIADALGVPIAEFLPRSRVRERREGKPSVPNQRDRG